MKTKHIDLKPRLHGKVKAAKLFFCAHFNLLQRFRMAMHWFRAYRFYELKHDNLNYDLYKFKYGNKTLLIIGTSVINPPYAFIKGWSYYPYYYKVERPKDIKLTSLPAIPVGNGIPFQTHALDYEAVYKKFEEIINTESEK